MSFIADRLKLSFYRNFANFLDYLQAIALRALTYNKTGKTFFILF